MTEIIDFTEKANEIEEKVFSCDYCDCVVFYVYQDAHIECGRCGNKYNNPEDLGLFIRKWCRKVEIDKSQSAEVIPIK